MNLVQKLPIGISLACVMMMSSCSKEDGLAPEPKTDGVTAHSNLKEVTGPGPVVITAGSFPSTNGPTGINIYPQNWGRSSTSGSNDVLAFPTGTSSLTHLWGDNNIPWVKPLQVIPGAQDPGSIVTVTTGTNLFTEFKEKSSVAKTTIKYLVPGKTYSITMYVANSIPKTPIAGKPIPVYANGVGMTMDFGYFAFGELFDLTGSNAVWVKKVIPFYAHHQEAEFRFWVVSSEKNGYSYGHIFVDKNSIKKLD